MSKRIIQAILMVFLLSSQLYTVAQSTVTVKGRIENTWTSEELIGVTVYIRSLGLGTSTDLDGNFKLEVPKGTFWVEFSRVDMKPVRKLIDAVKDLDLTITMQEAIYNLDVVTVFSEAQDAKVKNLDVGKNVLNIEKISAIPQFMGEADVIKSLILLPGVSTVGEGSSGFNVRGGSVDQNLILQDEAIIFNPSHVFGFFSVFNPLIVNNATLYKSGVPTQYGGRLSSVLDVGLKEGDFNEYSVDGGLGLVASKIGIDGPILKDKWSLSAGARASYSDWILGFAEEGDLANSTASFYDINFKTTFRINNNNKISYSGYFSQDGFGFASDTTFNWSTFNNSLLWTSILNEKMTFKMSLVSGTYDYTIEDEVGIDAFEIKSEIQHKAIKGVFDYNISKTNKLTVGVQSILYDFQPGEQSPLTDDSGVEYLKLEDERSLESGIFVEDEFRISPKLSVRAGVRFSHYANLGPGVDFEFEEGNSRNLSRVTDTIRYDDGELFATYSGIEPRINLNYLISPSSSIKISYNRMRQYLHFISNTAAATPTDFWKTSNLYLPPEVGDQYSIGYFRNFRNNTIEASVEAYYKTAENIVEFKNGSKLLMNEYLEADLLPGEAEAYGLEFFLNKKSGRLTGWMSYTFSRTFRTVNGVYEDEIISNGEQYPSNFDKPHDLTFALNYEPNPILSYGFNFTYSTGRPNTSPVGAYNLSNLSYVFNYSTRNAQRIPDYHRLDASMTIKSKPKINRKWKLSWTIAIYNLYGRKNAYSVFYENRFGDPPRAYKLSVLGGAFPSLTLNFKL